MFIKHIASGDACMFNMHVFHSIRYWMWYIDSDVRHNFDIELRGGYRIIVFGTNWNLKYLLRAPLRICRSVRGDTQRRVRPKVSKDFSWEVMRENVTWNEKRADTRAHISCVSVCARRWVRGSENVRSRCTIARCVRNIKSRFYGYCSMPRTFFFSLPLLSAGDATAGVRVSHGSGTLHARNY